MVPSRVRNERSGDNHLRPRRVIWPPSAAPPPYHLVLQNFSNSAGVVPCFRKHSRRKREREREGGELNEIVVFGGIRARKEIRSDEEETRERERVERRVKLQMRRNRSPPTTWQITAASRKNRRNRCNHRNRNDRSGKNWSCSRIYLLIAKSFAVVLYNHHRRECVFVKLRPAKCLADEMAVSFRAFPSISSFDRSIQPRRLSRLEDEILTNFDNSQMIFTEFRVDFE